MLEIIFPTAIFRHSPSNKDGLLSLVREHLKRIPHEEARPGHSTRGGTQSPPTFFNSDARAVHDLKGEILTAVRRFFPHFHQIMTRPGAPVGPLDFDLWGWVTTFTEAGWNAPHIHPLSLLSGVYWVQTPSQVLDNSNVDFAGWLGFQDPRTGSQTWPLPGHLSNYYVPPEPGALILFPSYLNHFVPPFTGNGTRTSIAFNLRHKSAAELMS